MPPQQVLIPTSQVALDVLDQTEMISQDVRSNAMQAFINYKACYYRKATLQSSKKQIMCMSYSQKQIIKAKKFFLRNSFGLAPLLLKLCYQTTNIWYAKLAAARDKCFMECNCVSSHPDNPYTIYRLRHKNGNLIK